jgi:uncharacterized protein YdeI (YjbR/CyaY-like superfamily)
VDPTKLIPTEKARIYAHDRKEWRRWLEANHDTSSGVWLVCFKKDSSKRGVLYDEAVEEALCFGWIDSKANALDEKSYIQLFSPRRPKSPWSKLNKLRVNRLVEQCLMTQDGIDVIEASKKDGSWYAYDMIEELRIPSDLKKVLSANQVADTHFKSLSKSSKKQILWWIQSAKRRETRQKRIDQVVELAKERRNPLNYAVKKKLS